MNPDHPSPKLVSLCGLALLVAMLGIAGVAAGPAAKVLAKIGGRVITLEEFQDRLRGIPDSVRNRLMTPEGLRTYLLGMVVKDVFAREALRLGLDKDPKVRAQLEEAKQQILYGAFVEHVTSQLTVTETELRAYFEAHRGDFGGKDFPNVRVEVAQKARDAKYASLVESARLKAWKRWGVTVNEALLSEVAISPDQTTRDREKALQELEQRVGPLSEEQRRAFRQGEIRVIPLQP